MSSGMGWERSLTPEEARRTSYYLTRVPARARGDVEWLAYEAARLYLENQSLKEQLKQRPAPTEAGDD